MTKEILGRLLDDIQKVQAVWLIDSLLLKVRLNINREMIINSKGSASKISFSLDMIQRRKEVRQWFSGQRLLVTGTTDVSALRIEVSQSLGNRVPRPPWHSITHWVPHETKVYLPQIWSLGSPTSRRQEDKFHCDVSFLCLSPTLPCVFMNCLGGERAQAFWCIFLEGTKPFRLGEHPSDFI